MKIAINARFLLPGKLEGLGWYTHEIVRRLVKSHPEDEFFLLFDRPFDPQFVYGENVRPVSVFPPARHPFLWFWWFEFSLPAALAKISPDVFFSPDSFLSLCAKTPTVMTLHDIIPLHSPENVPFPSRHFYQYFMPRYARRADKLICVSEFVKKDISSTIGVPESKIEVVPNGCREVFRPISEPEKRKVREEFSEGQDYFFYAGAIHPRKNLARLIAAFDAFKTQTRSGTKLLIGGRMLHQTGEIMAAFESSKHKNDIRFLGYLPENQLNRLLASAMALVYVSLEEGFGLPILEAFNAGTPVLASGTSSLPEVAGDAAVLVNPFDENEISAAMGRLFLDEKLRSQLVEKGLKRGSEFSWDLAAERVYSVLSGCGLSGGRLGKLLAA